MKVLFFDNDEKELQKAKALLQEKGFTCTIEDAQNLAEMSKIITKKKLDFQIDQLQNQLTELDSLYQRISERIRGFMKINLPNFEIPLVDNLIEELSGYSLDKWKDQPNFLRSIVHPDFKDYYDKKCNEMKKGIVPKVMEYKIITKNGEERWWLQFNIGSYDINAHLTSVSSIIVDNTERKIAEIKLKESEEKFRSLVQQSVAGIIIVKDNQIIFANDVVAKQSGLDISTITSLEIDDLNQIIHPEDFNFVKKQVQIASEKGSVPEFYARGIRPDGKIIWFAAQLNRFSYEESSAVAAILVGVTERIELQHKLIKERNKAQKYFDIAGTLLVVLDTNCNVVQINRRGSNILQYPKEEIIGKNWIENFIPQKNRAKARNIFSQILNEEIQPEDTFQNYVLTKKGEERLIIWHNTYLKNEEGKIESVISSGEDVTNLINL